MPTMICIHVFRGDQPELLPAMCMFCARPLTEDEYQQVVVKIGAGSARPIALPICAGDRLPGGVLYPDGHGQANVNTVAMGVASGVLGAALAHNLQRQQEGMRTTFTFKNIHDKFASELERLRNLTPAQYDQMMAQANQAFAHKIAAGTLQTEEDALRVREKEQQQVADAAVFGLQDAAGKGKVAGEVTRSSGNKFLIASLIVGAVSVLALLCISTSVIGYLLMNRSEWGDDAGKKKKLAVDPPKELRAKIKIVDKEQGTIQFLLPGSARATYRVADDTVFYDRAGNRLEQGIGTPALAIDEYCVILPTEDRKGLQWLKLTEPPP